MKSNLIQAKAIISRLHELNENMESKQEPWLDREANFLCHLLPLIVWAEGKFSITVNELADCTWLHQVAKSKTCKEHSVPIYVLGMILDYLNSLPDYKVQADIVKEVATQYHGYTLMQLVSKISGSQRIEPLLFSYGDALKQAEEITGSPEHIVLTKHIWTHISFEKTDRSLLVSGVKFGPDPRGNYSILGYVVTKVAPEVPTEVDVGNWTSEGLKVLDCCCKAKKIGMR